MLRLCTVFDKNYLLKGLAMHHSLQQTMQGKYELHVLALDPETSGWLTSLHLPNVMVHSLQDAEKMFPELKKARELPASKYGTQYSQYVWSLTPWFVDYLLNNAVGPDEHLMYVDSDIYFYSSPEEIIDGMGDRSVAIHTHRFSERKDVDVGWYNVGVIAFKKDETGLSIAANWKAWLQSTDHEYYEKYGTCGDQKYLEVFELLWPKALYVFDEESNIGHLAPWNCSRLVHPGRHKISWKGKIQPVLFFHFSHFTIDGNTWRDHVNKDKPEWRPADQDVIKEYYEQYAKVIFEMKAMVEAAPVPSKPKEVQAEQQQEAAAASSEQPATFEETPEQDLMGRILFFRNYLAEAMADALLDGKVEAQDIYRELLKKYKLTFPGIYDLPADEGKAGNKPVAESAPIVETQSKPAPKGYPLLIAGVMKITNPDRLKYLIATIKSYDFLKHHAIMHLVVDTYDKAFETLGELVRDPDSRNIGISRWDPNFSYGENYLSILNQSNCEFVLNFMEDQFCVLDDAGTMENILNLMRTRKVDICKTSFNKIEQKSSNTLRLIENSPIGKIFRNDEHNHSEYQKHYGWRFYIGVNFLTTMEFARKFWGRKIASNRPHEYEIGNYFAQWLHTAMIPNKEIQAPIDDPHGEVGIDLLHRKEEKFERLFRPLQSEVPA